MVQATEVFTPTDVPTLTYVERASRNFEADLRNAFKIPKMIVSISGPSKSGKTVLVTKVVAPENLIHIYGAKHKNARGPRRRLFPPASGSSRERFARDSVVAMDDPRRRKRMSLQESVEAVPGEHALTIPTGQPFLPDPHDFMGVPP